MAHTVGSLFHVAHGLADAIILPYIIQFNSGNERARALYESVAATFGTDAVSYTHLDVYKRQAYFQRAV